MLSSVNASTQTASIMPITQSAEQQVQALLNSFDTNNLTAEDATNIISGIEALGIEPSDDLVALIAANGFDAQTISDIANDVASSSDIENASEIVSFIGELLESYDADDSSAQNKDSLLAVVQEKFAIADLGSLFSIKV